MSLACVGSPLRWPRGFLFNAVGVQHSALLQRQMRFTIIATIETIATVASVVVGIGMALRGFGYWALVGMTVGYAACLQRLGLARYSLDAGFATSANGCP